jgi:hypothetical protein
MSNRQSRRSFLQIVKSWWGRIRNKPQPPDPYAEIPVRVRRGPKGRSGAAVADPEEYSFDSFPPRRI